MKKRWITTAALVLAGLLVLSLFFNNFIKDIPIQLYASEEEAELTVTSGDVEMLEVADSGEAGEASIVVENDGDAAVVENMQQAHETAVALDGVSEDLDTLAADGGDGSVVVEDNGEPAVLAEGTSGTHLPTTEEGYTTAAATTKVFYITTYDEFLAMQTLCDTALGFKDITLIIATPASESGGIWNIAGQDGFTGIGTEANPFQGTIYCDYDSGVQLQMDTPLFAYLGDGADVHQLNFVSSGVSAVIADTITGAVSISDIDLVGTVANAGGAAGIIAANVKDGSNIALSDIRLGSSGISVTGGIAGGIAGVVGNNVTVTLGDNISLGSSDARVVVTGTTAAGGHFGTVTGSCSWELSDESKLITKVKANDAACYAGQFAGKLSGTADTSGQLNITDSNNSYSVTVDVSGTGNGGGLVGLCGSNTMLVKPTSQDGTEYTLSIAGTVSMTGGNAGAVVGEINAANMELRNYTVTATVSGAYAGGVVGAIAASKDIIANATISGGVSGSTKTGGIIGRVMEASAVELQGTIDVENINLTGATAIGTVVGEQNVSLVYLSEGEGRIDGVSQLRCPIVANDVVPKYMEVSTYGGIFRNQTMTSGGKLIGDGTLANVGVINNSIIQSDAWYQLGVDGETDAAADLETLAIALYTDGSYGLGAFEGATSYSDLLAGCYTLNANANISYDTTGIITINRPDKDDAKYAFSGKVKGVNENITITQNIRLYQYYSWYLGLFRTLGGDAAFSNLIIDGNVRLATSVGGLAYQSIGTSLTLENVQMKKAFVECNNTSAYNKGVGGFLVSAKNTAISEPFKLKVKNVTLASNYSSTLEKFSSFIVEMDNAIVDIDTVKIGGSLKGTKDTAGGFLGNTWTNTGGTIKNISVLEGTTYTASGVFGALFNTVTTKDTRLTLDTVKLANLTVNANADMDCCGLLVQNAQNLVLEVIDYDSTGCVVNDPGAYFDEIAGVSRAYGSLGAMTGIVSIYKRPDSATEGTTTLCFPEYHYENKVESLKSVSNPYTMYFYDVFQRLEAEGVTLDTVLDTETEILLWDILHYANDGNVWKYFNTYLGAAQYSEWKSIYWETQYSFAGNLDLSTISFYPVTRVGGVYECNNAVISFDASKMKDWTLNNTNRNSQHYGLNAGLFMDTGNMTVNNLTLTGNVANLGAKSGALVCGSSGLKDGWIVNITIKDLWICEYSATQEEPGAGLLISNVPGSAYEEGVEVECDDTNFYGITMTGYEDAGDKKAAAALIGSAGGENVNNLILNFKYMDIADDRDDRTDGGHNGKVLAYASFLYNYNYTNDAKINEGYGLYLFSEDDYKADNVTFGEELDFDTEFSDNSNTVFDPDKDPAPSTLYKPYVYQIKDIEVNPKSGDILKGCGTYEDPYIIETAKQFLTLYRYMNETGTVGQYQYETFYDGWQVIKIGDDSTFCATKHNVAENADGSFTGDGAVDVVTYEAGGENADFPTPDEMSRAYYQLGEDLDLSVEMSTTYAQIAQDFVGFGTEERPFVGVWYGKDSKGIIHTITLPDKTTTDPYATYGFIQYAKGAVVKDMIIRTSEEEAADEAEDTTEGTVDSAEGTDASNSSGESTADTTTNVRAQISKMGGGVIACILGGDNIIDNVTVAVEYKVADENAVIGGYVGNVRKGGLILRNVSEGTAATAEDGTTTEGTPAVPGSLSGFRLDQASNQRTVEWNGNYTASYEHLGAVVGKVEDGYVLYEGSLEEGVLWSGTGGNAEYSQVPGYNILNGTNLKNESNGLVVTKEANAEAANIQNITFTIPNAAALQTMSMALNADALNIRPSDYGQYTVCGYTELSRSRKAAYSDIGCTDASTEDYVFAAKYDNVMSYAADGYSAANQAYAYPYLYQYMGITDATFAEYLVAVTASDGVTAQGYSILNPAIVIEGVNYIVQWNLAENAVSGDSGSEDGASYGILYDMSVFENGFRGLGAVYGTKKGVEYGGAFHGNFDGKNNTIKINMNRYLMGADKTDTTNENRELLASAALFNVLYGRDEALYQTMVDFKDIDAAASSELSAAEIKNFTLTGYIATDRGEDGVNYTVGGVAAWTSSSQARYVFDNIIVEDFQVSRRYMYRGAGNVGGIVGYAGTSCNVLLQNCYVRGTTSGSVEMTGQNNIGGLVGITKAATLKIVNCGAENMKLQADSNNAAGFVGWTHSSGKNVIVVGTDTNNCTVKNSQLLGNERGGGLIGGADSNLQIAYASVEGVTLAGYNHMGGIVGSTESNRTSKISNVNVKDVKTSEVNLYNGATSGIGGIVGRNGHTLTIQNARAEGTISEAGVYNHTLHAGNNKLRSGSNGAGGIVGVHAANVLTLTDCSVEQVSISTDVSPTNTNGGTTFYVNVAAGGIVGYVSAPVILDGAITTTDTRIAAPQRSEATQNIMAAGGCFGYVAGPSAASYDYIIRGTEAGTVYQGLTSSGNTITGKQAGGMIGYVSNQNTGVRLSGINVENGTVTSDEIAGGVFGYISPGFKGTVLDNNATNTVTNMQVSGRMAGGVIGELNIYGDMRMESLVLTDNSITARQTIDGAAYGVGGVIGNCCGLHDNPFKLYDIKLYNNTIACETDAATLTEGETDKLAAGGLIGRTYKSGATSITEILCDNIVIDATNEIGVKQTAAGDDEQTTANDVMLVTYDDTNTQYKLAAPTVTVPGDDTEYKYYEALQDITADYGYYVGNFVGVWESEELELYILRSNSAEPKFAPPMLAANPPVTDVGRTSTQAADAYRSDCHIIYGAAVTDAADARLNLADMKSQVDAVNTAYANTDGLSILQEYRLSEQAVDWFGKLYQDTFTFSEGKTIGFPVLVYKTEYGTLQEIMEAVTDVMTNVAGASASDLPGEFLSITCKQMLCNGTTVVEGEGTASITAVTENGVTTYSSSQYDGIVELEDKSYVSYTEITFVYGWEGHAKTFKLPVFVEEPILYGVHSMLIEGKVTDVETIETQGIAERDNEIIMANDSDYTLLLEYTYGKARKNMPDSTSVDKVFYLEQNNGLKKLAVGTKLMLIDITNGNRAYYYTVESSDVTQILFTDFKDSAGNSYVNHSINKLPDAVDEELAEDESYYTDLGGHKLMETGVERFLLTVLAADNAAETNEVYTINTGIQIEDEGLASRFDTLEEHGEWAQFGVKSVPGLVINFAEKGAATDIEGSISKEGGLTVKACIEIKAKAGLYWAEKTSGMDVIDSSNNGKFLDLAFYLRDLSGNRVNFPSGTNFSYKVGNGIRSDKKVISNDSVIYYYKDIRDGFSKADSQYEIGNIEKDTTISLEFYLDFSGADFSNVAEEKYAAWLDLLRTSNKDYPMGNDNKLDDYTEELEANAAQQMGFAIRAQDLYELAINTYPEVSEQNTIHYNVMFDFSDILKQTTGAGTNALVQKWAGFDYTVTYQIYEKTVSGDTVTYEPYTEDEIVLTATGAVNADNESVSVTSSNGAATALYRFTEAELSKNEGLMTFPGTIAISTKSLIADDLTKLTNYKVQATLTITERGTTTQPAEQTIDFFIYTITKLKTDI